MIPKIEGAGALTVVFGLVTWYAGGSSALDRMLTARPLLWASLFLAVVAALLGFFLDPRACKKALASGAVLGAGVLLSSVTVGALLNERADTSSAWVEPAIIDRFKAPNKGARMVTLRWRARRVDVQARHASGCEVSDEARLTVRAGAFGLPWLASLACDTTR